MELRCNIVRKRGWRDDVAADSLLCFQLQYAFFYARLNFAIDRGWLGLLHLFCERDEYFGKLRQEFVDFGIHQAIEQPRLFTHAEKLAAGISINYAPNDKMHTPRVPGLPAHGLSFPAERWVCRFPDRK